MKKIFTFLMAFSAFYTASALDANHFTITRITAPYFIVDANSPATITSAYVGFEVKNNSNSATTYSGLKFTITSIGTTISGQNYSLVSPASGITNVGTLLPGQSKVCYYYVSYPASVTPQATFNISLADNTAGTKTQSFVVRNRSSISANAGGTATQSFSNQDIIGGLITDDVTYVVGNVQNSDESDFQVAVSSQFDPTKVSLLGTEVISSSVPGIPAGTTDSLYFVTGNGTNGATVTIRWTFRISGFNFTTYLLPCAGATSGSTNYKYALNTSLGSGTPVTVSSSANPLIILKTSDKTLYGTNAVSVFTVTIQNPGAYPVTIDKITDEIPAGFSFTSLHASSQVTAANSTSIPSAGATGTITFDGAVASGSNMSYYIPAGGSILLKYNATTAASSASNLTTTARGYVSTTQVGAAQTTVSVSATLPVTLLSFKASISNSKSLVEWTTTNEINSLSFEIEKSSTGNDFIKIGEIAANTNVAAINSYSFVDNNLTDGLTYYRLKIIDTDGSYKYSNITTVKRVRADAVKNVFPNPFTTELTIDLYTNKSGKVLISLYDITGKLISQQTELCPGGDHRIKLDKFGKLNTGTYCLQVLINDKSEMIKLVKAN